jgi:hypothetical protein
LSGYYQRHEIKAADMNGALGMNGRDKMAYKVWFENLKGKIRLEKLEVNGRIIFTCILKRQGVATWTGLIWLRIGISGGIL